MVSDVASRNGSHVNSSRRTVVPPIWWLVDVACTVHVGPHVRGLVDHTEFPKAPRRFQEIPEKSSQDYDGPGPGRGQDPRENASGCCGPWATQLTLAMTRRTSCGSPFIAFSFISSILSLLGDGGFFTFVEPLDVGAPQRLTQHLVVDRTRPAERLLLVNEYVVNDSGAGWVEVWGRGVVWGGKEGIPSSHLLVHANVSLCVHVHALVHVILGKGKRRCT